MNFIFQLLMVLVPTAAIMLTTYLFLKRGASTEVSLLHADLKKQRQEYFLPSRLEAYQRSVLLMERIHPNNLVMRLHNPILSAKSFQKDLLTSIREEYDHNVAQQLFIAPDTWQMVKKSKEETIKIINLAGSRLAADATSADLANKIFELIAEIGQLPTEIVIEQLKKELQSLF